jgi:hypothetical protein
MYRYRVRIGHDTSSILEYRGFIDSLYPPLARVIPTHRIRRVWQRPHSLVVDQNYISFREAARVDASSWAGSHATWRFPIGWRPRYHPSRQKHRPTAHTYEHHFSLSLSPQFSLTRGKKFNGILERETRERKGLVQLLPKVINLILNFTVFHWLSSCSAKLQFLILFFSSLLWSLNCFLIFSYNN